MENLWILAATWVGLALIETRMAVGHPTKQIIRKAKQDHASPIIVGRRSMPTFQKLVMSLMSGYVLRCVPCSGVGSEVTPWLLCVPPVGVNL